MEQRPLGRTGLSVSALGLGGAPIGNPARCPDDTAAVAVVHRAQDRGITINDTAPRYGGGESERRIGLALRSHPLGSQCVVATKVGYVPDAFDYSAEATVASVRASQERLGLERIPLVQIHELRAEIVARAMAPDGALAGLERLKAEGVIEHIGVTGSDLAALGDAVRTGAFETLLIWRHLHLLDATGAAVVRAAAARGMGIIVGTPYAGSILATGNRPDATYLYEPASPEVQAHVVDLERHCADHGVSLRTAALQWPLRLPGVATIIAGAESPTQIDENAASLTEAIPAYFWEGIDPEG